MFFSKHFVESAILEKKYFAYVVIALIYSRTAIRSFKGQLVLRPFHPVQKALETRLVLEMVLLFCFGNFVIFFRWLYGRLVPVVSSFSICQPALP